jgi:type II restriction enzyme
MSKSEGLSNRLTQLVESGRHLNDDSASSEKTLSEAMTVVISYATELFSSLGYTIVIEKTISLYECQTHFEMAGGPQPDPNNKKVCMKPDGGILFAVKDKARIPILIVEDKVQGTNDTLFEKKLKRQATGNAIERGGKNIRGAEMLFANTDIFPYILFASGCDFHSSETIAKRLEMMNMGVPNHYIEITPTTTQESVNTSIDKIKEKISVKKLCGKDIASIFVKTHKWDTMKHGSSLWNKDEQVTIIKKVLDKVFESFRSS